MSWLPSLRRLLPLALLLPACRVGEDYRAPEPSVPAAFTGPVDAPLLDTAEAAREARWWTLFGDPLLEELVERALAGNLELAIAAQRIREARAGIAIVGGDARPSADLGASALRRESSNSVAGGEFLPAGDAAYHSLGFDARWELDLFGRTARSVEAAKAERDGLVEDSRAILLSVVAEVARNYVELRASQAELALLTRELASQRETVELVDARVRAGLEDELALARARALASGTAARLPDLARRAAAHAHALAVLLGEWPGELDGRLEPDAEASAAAGIPVPPERIAAGLPLELVRRRPDVRRSERALARASALSAMAVAELYPRVTLGLSVGQESEHLADLFDADARSFSFGPSLLTPLFHGGILRWAIRARDAQEEAARLAHERSVLEALRDVEDALVQWSRSRERLPSLEAARAHQDEALRLARERYTGGLEDFLGVLDAERGRLEAEAEEVRGRAAVTTSAIALYKALAGGWEEAEPRAPALVAARQAD